MSKKNKKKKRVVKKRPGRIGSPAPIRQNAVPGIEPLDEEQRILEAMFGEAVSRAELTALSQVMKTDFNDEQREMLRELVSTMEAAEPQLRHALAASTPREQAQQLMEEAYESDRETAVDLAKDALALFPDCAPALLFMGQFGVSSRRKSLRYFLLAARAADGFLSEQVALHPEKNIWEYPETAVLYRALYLSSVILWELGQRSEAISTWRALLRLDPEDSEDVRPVFVHLLVAESHTAEASQILSEFVESRGESTATLFARALLIFAAAGPGDQADTALEHAIESNRHVLAYLVGDPPDKEPGSSGDVLIGSEEDDTPAPGSEEEAESYSSLTLSAWRAVPGAIRWVLGFYEVMTEGEAGEDESNEKYTGDDESDGEESNGDETGENESGEDQTEPEVD